MQQQIKKMKRVGSYRLDESMVLGKGSTGFVYAGFHSETNERVAIKAIDMKYINNDVTRYLLQGEKRALKIIKNEYVVRGIEVIQHEDFCYMIMEEYRDGTLKDRIEKSGKFPIDVAIELFRKILSGYSAIVDGLFIHRDLKTANIMLKNTNHPVIIDFGYCEMIMGKRPMIQYNVGSPSYMAPESFLKSRYSEKSDIWSLGAIFYEMLTAKTLDHGFHIQKFFNDVTINKRLSINFDAFTPICRDILRSALEVDPQKRATVHKLKYIIDKSMIPKMKVQLQKAHSAKESPNGKPVPKIQICQNYQSNLMIRRESDREGKVFSQFGSTRKKHLDETKQTTREEKKIEKPSSIGGKPPRKPEYSIFMTGSKPVIPSSPKTQLQPRQLFDCSTSYKLLHQPPPQSYLHTLSRKPILRTSPTRGTGSMLTIKAANNPPKPPQLKKMISDPVTHTPLSMKMF